MHVKRVHRSRQELAVTGSEISNSRQHTSLFDGGFRASVIWYTTRNTQVAASLLQACYLTVIKSISGCVRITCSDLMITSLLQVVNRLDAS